MKVKSGQVDHIALQEGLYLSEEIQIGKETLYVYDLRFLEPYKVNSGAIPPMSREAQHTCEHLLAYALRQECKEGIIVSVYPYGCGTGFGVITDLMKKDFLTLLENSIPTMLEMKVIPFSTQVNCGNFMMHNLHQAQELLKQFARKLRFGVRNVPLLTGTHYDEVIIFK